MNKLIIILLISATLFAGMASTPKPKPTKVSIGKQLFSDKILSKNYTISCASCHIPAYGFADTVAFSMGINGMPTDRNTPSVLNMKYRPYFFWDGRAASLEEQSIMPIEHQNEMGLSVQEAVKRLVESTMYRNLFKEVFNSLPNKKNMSEAFAAFEKTLETGKSKFDLSFTNTTKLTAAEERGRKLFISDKTKCFDCHRGDDFTNDDFKNIGLYDADALNDKGRYNVTKDSADLGKFKTPGLRNVAITSPYMHNGKFKTLEQVIEFYNNSWAFVENPINIDSSFKAPLGLTIQNKKDLVAFLKTLTDKRYTKL